MQTQETNEQTVLTEDLNAQTEQLDDLTVSEETEADILGGMTTAGYDLKPAKKV